MLNIIINKPSHLIQQFRHTSGSHSLLAAKQGHWRLLHWLFAQLHPLKRILQVLGHLMKRIQKFKQDKKKNNETYKKIIITTMHYPQYFSQHVSLARQGQSSPQED